MAKRVVLADKLSDEGVDILADAGALDVIDLSSTNREQLKLEIKDASGLIVRSATQADSDLLAGADALEVIGRAGVGLDNIDLDEATRRGIAVLNAPAGNTTSTAELAFALLLSAARRIPAADRSVHKGEWARGDFKGSQLSGKALGVIGAGRIGTEVIRRARAFGMMVLVTDPYLRPERASDLSAELVDLDELLARADFVSLHVPLNDDTRDLIGEAELAAMKKTAYLVNAARGGIVDEAALSAALHRGELAGAALDVFAQEPLPADHQLRDAPHLVLTPHLGASTEEAQREVAIEIAHSVRSALLDGDFSAAVNVPRVDPTTRDRFDPVLDLARRLGAVLAGLTDARADRVEVRFAGPFERVLRLIAAAAMEGYLRRTLATPLNMVNSLLLASERGIEVSRSRVLERPGYSSYLELSAVASGGEFSVSGAILGDQHPRLVRLGEYHINVVPRGTLVILRNHDVPGVIGDVGTRLGESAINIAEFHQARSRIGGETLAVIALEEPLPEEVVAALRGLDSVIDVRQVSFRR